MSWLTWNWQYLKWINESQKSHKRSMARTIKGETKREGQRKAKRCTALMNQKKRWICLSYVCLLSGLFLQQALKTWWIPGANQKNKGQNWSTTHVSVFGKQTQKVKLGYNEWLTLGHIWPVGSFYQCLIDIRFPPPPSPPPHPNNLVIFKIWWYIFPKMRKISWLYSLKIISLDFSKKNFLKKKKILKKKEITSWCDISF